MIFFFLVNKRFYLFFREKRREGEREGEKHQCVVASHTPPTGDLACNPGMCPDWESTHDPLVHRLALHPLSHTSQGWFMFLKAHSLGRWEALVISWDEPWQRKGLTLHATWGASLVERAEPGAITKYWHWSVLVYIHPTVTIFVMLSGDGTHTTSPLSSANIK